MGFTESISTYQSILLCWAQSVASQEISWHLILITAEADLATVTDLADVCENVIKMGKCLSKWILVCHLKIPCK